MLKQCFLGVGARFFLHKEALLVQPKCGLAETGCVLVAQKTTRSLTSASMSYVLAITHISKLRCPENDSRHSDIACVHFWTVNADAGVCYPVVSCFGGYFHIYISLCFFSKIQYWSCCKCDADPGFRITLMWTKEFVDSKKSEVIKRTD